MSRLSPATPKQKAFTARLVQEQGLAHGQVISIAKSIGASDDDCKYGLSKWMQSRLIEALLARKSDRDPGAVDPGELAEDRWNERYS